LPCLDRSARFSLGPQPRHYAVVKRGALSFDALVLDRDAGETLTRQIVGLLRTQILRGRLPIGTRLPSSRALAQQLGVGRNTVLAAYEQLLAEGYIEAEAGAGTWIAFKPSVSNAVKSVPRIQPRLSRRGALMARDPQPTRSPNKINLQPGFPETVMFPSETWSRLLSRNARQRGGDMIGYYDYAGHHRLREAIAGYVGVARGVDCGPEQVIVVTGAQGALDLISRVVLDDGDPVWMEDPGYLGAHSALTASGAKLVPLKIDDTGWRLDDPALLPPRAIYVTPSCQWPLGRSMSVNDRMRLLSLAEAHNAWLIEDDYDGEYRFRGQPVPALYGLDRTGCVIYIGTFGKVLFSSLRIGFLVVPSRLSEACSRAVSVTGHFAPLLLQSTLADFMQEGHFALHLKRMRRLYTRRQAMLIELCEDRLARWISVSANDTGMQLLARLRPSWDDRIVAAAALRRGVDVQPVSINYRYQVPEHGLLLGFAALNEKAMSAAVSGLEEAFKELERNCEPNGSAK
jgi:GntR family transcriptional regulator / MocR family aminotransferase